MDPGQKLALEEAQTKVRQAHEKLEVVKAQNLAKADCVATMAKALADTAKIYGVVVTVSTSAHHPPQMGRYDMRWEVRPSREMYQQEAGLFREYLEANDTLQALEKALTAPPS